MKKARAEPSKEPKTVGRVLVIAGSDSGGGAGIQADIKSIQAMGGYGMTAITALTAQNTQGVYGIFAVAPSFVVEQAKVVLSDIGADAIKTGMLANADVMRALAPVLANFAGAIIVDPVMVASSGDRLLQATDVATFKDCILPRATLLTPNLREAEILTDTRIETIDDMKRAGEKIMKNGAKAVLIKGGHAPPMEGQVVVDLLATDKGFSTITNSRIPTQHTHGTGCTLASAIATKLAQGVELLRACEDAAAYVHRAIYTAPKLGLRAKGTNYPINHGA